MLSAECWRTLPTHAPQDEFDERFRLCHGAHSRCAERCPGAKRDSLAQNLVAERKSVSKPTWQRLPAAVLRD